MAMVLSTKVSAVAGCINAARDRIYTSKQSGQNYYRTSTYQTATTGCLYVYTGAICSIGSSNANNGYMGDTNNALQCPIDDYVGVMIVFFAGLGYLLIRRNNTPVIA